MARINEALEGDVGSTYSREERREAEAWKRCELLAKQTNVVDCAILLVAVIHEQHCVHVRARVCSIEAGK